MKDIANDQVTLGNDNEECHMCPCKKRKLLHVVALDQRQDKPDETNNIEREWDETVVLDHSSQEILHNPNWSFHVGL